MDKSNLNHESTTAIPKYGFKVKLNHVYPERRSPHFKPSFKIIWDLLPLFLRYIWYYIVYKFKGKSIVMDYIYMQTAKQIYGVPIGGIGSGTIGRGYKGEFCRFQLRPDVCEYNTVDANQFIVTIRDKSQKTIFQSVLSTYTKKKLPKTWENLLDGGKCNYTGLYPRSWTEYDLSEYGVKLTCRQVSPVIPHDYESSCLPCAVFVWNVENVGNTERTVTISFTFKNGTGTKKSDKQSACSSKSFQYQNSEGVILYHTIEKTPSSYTLAVKSNDKIEVTRCLSFNPNSDGSQVWNELKTNGHFDKSSEKPTKNPHIFGEMGVGVAAKTTISEKASQDIEMVLVWDMPSIVFPVNQEKYFRYYTRKFGRENAALKIVDFAAKNYQEWEKKIFKWQEPILNDMELPDWYKSALFNESYFISDGGTVWLDLDDDTIKQFGDGDPRKEYGRFAYLEGHEYRMYNSFDVHFYASHALSHNFPMLQKCLHYDLRDFVALEIPQRIEMLYDGKIVERKYAMSVPHDAGDPGENPFLLINAYPIHDVSNWKDLCSKFVLQTFRDGSCNAPDTKFLKDMFETCDTIMQKSLKYDVDDDGVIENSGEPDQTFDTWVMTGTSSYCGGLWLAAVYAMSMMATWLNNSERCDFYQKLLKKGTESFHKKLWNGKYYNFDCSETQYNGIMADQLNAQWYLGCIRSADSYPIFPKENVKSALMSIYENNVLCFCEGTMGAVNGFINGQVDQVTIQSQEVWTGVTYALAATMIQEGMFEEAFKTAGGMFQSMTEKFGMIFDTPEALYAKNFYRSVGYMRPLSIWSMQIAWENREKSLEG
ncbi:non-lysosomal glucosylceramidase [Anthonomus grandis grandis]|uniref:non-lysosomal glucosylceramidase n=1 Tax=Anthonomus grandis grandis TaxID=2921223 RepID=UPI00216524A2|nr:non-lysosomal glucosylceramidase [Anthonomus grandis grandis]